MGTLNLVHANLVRAYCVCGSSHHFHLVVLMYTASIQGYLSYPGCCSYFSARAGSLRTRILYVVESAFPKVPERVLYSGRSKKNAQLCPTPQFFLITKNTTPSST